MLMEITNISSFNLTFPHHFFIISSAYQQYTRLNHFLSEVDISEGMLDLEHNIPSNRIQLISPTANLVVREDFHPALSDLMLQAATSIHGGSGMFEDQGEFPSPKRLAFPLSKEAARFYQYGPSFLQRYLPFWVATLLDRLKVLILPLIVLLIPLFKIVPPTFRWRIRSRITRWYKEIQVIDMVLDEEPEKSELDQLASDIVSIDRQVTQVHVPLGYADQLYDLRLHIDLVKKKIDSRRSKC